MSDWRTLSVALRADVANYQRNLNSAASSTDKVGKSWASTSKLVKAGVAAIGVAAVALVNSSIQYQTAMLNVQSLGTETDASMKRLSASVLDMSSRLPQSAQTLAEGLYDIESSGFAGAGALKVLEASAGAASAGLSDTATSARAITGVLNAYGMGADKAQHVSDVLFQTVNLGVVSFSDLAQSMGQYVSTASAAGVSIEQASAAMATITLSGVPAAEASTALNAVLTAFIQPSKGLAAELSKLGLSLDDLKNPAIGLSGVMKRISKDTGGNVAAMSGMFTNVRALRGALALLNNDGKNWDRTLNGINHSSDGVGAMHKALATQMQGLGAQLTIAKNRAMAYFLTISLSVIPAVRHLADMLGDFLASAGDRLHQTWGLLQDAGHDLAKVLADVASGAKPIASLFAGMIGGTVVLALRTLAGLLSTTARLLADHPGLVRAIGAAFAAWGATKALAALQPMLATVGLEIAALGERAVLSFGKADAALTMAAGSTAGFKLAMTSLGTSAVVLGSQLALAVGGMNLFRTVASVQGDAAKADAKFLAGVDKVDPAKRAASLKDLQGQLAASRTRLVELQGGVHESFTSWKSWGNSIQNVTSGLMGNESETWKTRSAYESHLKTVRELAAQNRIVEKRIRDVGTATGMSQPKVVAMVKALNLDPTKMTAAAMIGQINGKVKDLATQSGLAAPKVKSLLDRMSPDQAEEFAKAMSDVTEKVSDAFSKYTDLSSIKDLQFAPDLSMNGWQLGANIQKIQAFYKERLAGARTFSSDMTAAIAQGYDPSFILQLAQQGPETAGPILRTLVAGYSSEMVNLVNGAQAQISRLNDVMAEKARATYMATTLNSDALTKDLSTYQQIVDAAAAGVKAPQIAVQLDLDAKKFNKTLTEFGNTSIPKLNEDISKHGINVPADVKLQTFQQKVATLRDIIAQGKNYKWTTQAQLNYQELMKDANVVGVVMGTLTAPRKAEVKPFADVPSIAAADKRLAELVRDRRALVKAGVSGAQLQAVDAEISYVSRQRDAKITVNANFDAAAYNLGLFGAKVAAVINAMNFVGGTVFATPSQGGGLSPGGQRNRYGGAYVGGRPVMAASGMIGRGNRTLYGWNEPGTGGEAFIPKLGISAQRAQSLLDVAAGWHGMAVTPKAKVAPFTPSGGVTIVMQTGDIKISIPSGSPQAIGPAVDAAMTQWVKTNPTKIIAAVGKHAARTGK